MGFLFTKLLILLFKLLIFQQIWQKSTHKNDIYIICSPWSRFVPSLISYKSFCTIKLSYRNCIKSNVHSQAWGNISEEELNNYMQSFSKSQGQIKSITKWRMKSSFRNQIQYPQLCYFSSKLKPLINHLSLCSQMSLHNVTKVIKLQ